MPSDDKRKKNKYLEEDEETGGQTGEEGSGGQTGQVEFRDFISAGESLRDDQLSGEEKRRLLLVHQNTHATAVLKQKKLLAERRLLKEGKLSLEAFRAGQMANTGYKIHPLSEKAQFSGKDKQVSDLPTENEANTNDKKQEELQYQYNLTHRPEYAHQPKFNPKPTPYR